jgi:hypothetical protein
MKTLRVVLPIFVILGGILGTSIPSSAKPEYTKKEKTGCVTCHVDAKSKELNPTGDCYKKNGSLASCKK